MNIHKDFSFDGFGINGRDEHRSRLATLTTEGHAEGVGPLLAAAPEMLAALEELEDALTHSGQCQCCQGSNDDGHDEDCRILIARKVIAKATS